MRVTTSSRRTRAGRWLTAAALATAAVVVPSLAAHADVPVAGTPVWIGDSAGPAGMGLYKVYVPVPGDTSNPGNPNYSGYSLEHDLEARSQITATAVEPSSYLGSNYFTDPTVQRQVLWLLANSYPALTTSQLAYNMGIPTMSQSQAIEATQYAIWRYTEYTSDVNWNFSSPAVQDIYTELLNGVTRAIRDHTLPVRADFEVTATITGPTAAQTADSLVGPFVVHTNKATASVSSDPAQKFTDAAGAPINANAVVDGQAVYLDLRGTKTAGSANVTVSAAGSSATGLVLNVPLKEGDTPTAGAHAQSLILATPSTTSTTASAAVQWTTTLHPSIGTTLVDASDQDHTLAWDGGTLTDTVAYHDLIPGTQYTVAGELMRASDSTGTGITGSTTFTPTTADDTVTVTFTVPTGYAGQSLVAFQSLYTGSTGSGTPIAVHQDINDTAQTVTLEHKPKRPEHPGGGKPHTGNGTTQPDAGSILAQTGGAVPIALTGTGVLALLAGVIMVAMRRRTRG